MLIADRTTLVQFLIEERRRHPSSTGELNGLITQIALASKQIAHRVAKGSLAQGKGHSATLNVQGEVQKELDVVTNDIFLRTVEWTGHVSGFVSEELEEVALVPGAYPKGKYLLVFDPLDGSTNIDVNVSVASIFSILRAKNPGVDAKAEDFLQPGTEQVAAGYAIYGPSTMFVITTGNGVHGFTLDQELGEFILTHPHLRVPEETQEFAINTSNSRFWEAPVKRYVEECLAGTNGPRGKDFNMRWIACMAADAHRVLMRGGVYVYPRDTKDPNRAGRLRLLYEANPIAMLMEQAGGKASTGRQPILEVAPSDIHQRIALIFGSRSEVERIERYHREDGSGEFASPLFQRRGLFQMSA